MDIIGHGVDIVEVDRIQTLLGKDDDFLVGWFTSREIQDLGNRADRADVVGGRVAAKEAAAKALGTGFDDEVVWHDIEILMNEGGAPRVVLSDVARDVATNLGIDRLFVSISHCRSAAIASVIAVGSSAKPFPGT